MPQSTIKLSIVLPVCNNEASVGSLLGELVSFSETTHYKIGEIIVVDDASDDKSVEVIGAAVTSLSARAKANRQSKPAEITLISQPERAGFSRSLMKGLNAARGEVLICIDPNGSCDPGEIAKLVDRIEQADMLCGFRKNRNDGPFKILQSTVGNLMRTLLTGPSIRDAGCIFRIMRTSCVPILRHYDGKLFGCEFYFHPWLLRKKGLRVAETSVTQRHGAFRSADASPLFSRILRGIAACVKARFMYPK